MTIKQYMRNRLDSGADYIGLVLACRPGSFALILPDCRDVDFESIEEIDHLIHGSHREQVFLVQACGGIGYAFPINFGDPVEVLKG